MSQSRPLPQHGMFETEGVHLHHLRGEDQSILMSPVIYIDAHNRQHVAHPGLITDGRSFRAFFYVIGTPYDNEHLEACIIHDWYCAKSRMLTGDARWNLRDRADKLFGECLMSLGLPDWKRSLMVRAVRKHAEKTQDDPIHPWQKHFISEEASHLGAENPFVCSVLGGGRSPGVNVDVIE